MGFFKDTFNNLFAFIFAILGIIFMGLSFLACTIVMPFAPKASGIVPFIIMFVIGLVFLSMARAFGKRG